MILIYLKKVKIRANIEVHVRVDLVGKRGWSTWEGGVLNDDIVSKSKERGGVRERIKKEEENQRRKEGKWKIKERKKGGRKFDEDHGCRSSHQEVLAPPTPLLRPWKSSAFFLPSSRLQFPKPISETRGFFRCCLLQDFLDELRFPWEILPSEKFDQWVLRVQFFMAQEEDWGLFMKRKFMVVKGEDLFRIFLLFKFFIYTLIAHARFNSLAED